MTLFAHSFAVCASCCLLSSLAFCCKLSRFRQSQSVLEAATAGEELTCSALLLPQKSFNAIVSSSFPRFAIRASRGHATDGLRQERCSQPSCKPFARRQAGVGQEHRQQSDRRPPCRQILDHLPPIKGEASNQEKHQSKDVMF